jgi:hypothetical protein
MQKITQAEQQVKSFIVREWKSPARRATEQLLLGWFFTAVGAGAAAGIQYASAGNLNNPALIISGTLAAAVLSLVLSAREYLAAHGDQVAKQVQFAPAGPDLAETVRTDILPFMRQELAGHANTISNKLQSSLAQMWQQMLQQSAPLPPSPLPPSAANLIAATKTQVTPAVRLPTTPPPVNLDAWPTGLVPVPPQQR